MSASADERLGRCLVGRDSEIIGSSCASTYLQKETKRAKLNTATGILSLMKDPGVIRYKDVKGNIGNKSSDISRRRLIS